MALKLCLSIPRNSGDKNAKFLSKVGMKKGRRRNQKRGVRGKEAEESGEITCRRRWRRLSKDAVNND